MASTGLVAVYSCNAPSPASMMSQVDCFKRVGSAIERSSSGKLRSRRRYSRLPRAAGTAEPDSSGTGGFGIVDANMMILRKRIEGLRVKEKSLPATHLWMDWEKTCYNSYRTDVGMFMGGLQDHLLNMRPSVALSVLSLCFAVFPAAAILFISALGSQIYSINVGILDFLSQSGSPL